MIILSICHILKNDNIMEDGLERKMRTLCLCEKSAICLEKPDPDYVLHVDTQTCSGNGKLAATTSNHSVRLYSRETLAFSQAISGPEKPLTGVKLSADVNLLFASSADGTVRCWDLRQKGNKEAQIFAGHEEVSDNFQAFDLSCDGRILCAGTEAVKGDCHLLFWDCRQGSTDLLGCYADCHQDDITQVRFHPSEANTLLTGSEDGLVCLFDISQEGEDDALTTTLNAESAVSRIGWCGTDSQVYCITRTRDLLLWEMHQYDTILDLRNVRDKVVGSDEVDFLVDCFDLTSDTTCVVAGSFGSGRFSVCDVTTSGLQPRWLAPTGGHSDDVRCVTWDKDSESLVTGGEDAMLCLWKLETARLNGATPETSQGYRDRRKAKASSKMKMKMSRSVTDSSRPF